MTQNSSTTLTSPTTFSCRAGCGACCIALSISSPLPGLPMGKKAGEKCPHLSPDKLCLIYGNKDRPAVCNNLRASEEMCGTNFAHAISYLNWLEQITSPR